MDLTRNLPWPAKIGVALLIVAGIFGYSAWNKSAESTRAPRGKGPARTNCRVASRANGVTHAPRARRDAPRHTLNSFT